VPEFLGKQRFFAEVAKRTAAKGVATGLVWTPVGGDIVFVESTVMPGSGKLTLTGQLGEVMKESAQAALSFLRSRSSELKLSDEFFNKHDVHIHVPAGAVPKDGPSAGVAMATSLVSALTGRHVDASVAMTGEITLTGQVLPIGGVKEKVLGAKRAGIKRVILPRRNEPDVSEDVPPEVRKTLKFAYVDDLSQVLSEALGAPIIKAVETTNGRRNGRQLPAAAR
jgi:ATP-dependent Lon protease